MWIICVLNRIESTHHYLSRETKMSFMFKIQLNKFNPCPLHTVALVGRHLPGDLVAGWRGGK